MLSRTIVDCGCAPRWCAFARSARALALQGPHWHERRHTGAGQLGARLEALEAARGRLRGCGLTGAEKNGAAPSGHPLLPAGRAAARRERWRHGRAEGARTAVAAWRFPTAPCRGCKYPTPACPRLLPPVPECEWVSEAGAGGVMYQPGTGAHLARFRFRLGSPPIPFEVQKTNRASSRCWSASS